MRQIELNHTDFDPVTDETWVDTEPGILLTPHVVLYSGQSGFGFHYFEEAIADDQPSVNTAESNMIDFTISGASIEGIDLAALAIMTVAELAEALASRLN